MNAARSLPRHLVRAMVLLGLSACTSVAVQTPLNEQQLAGNVPSARLGCSMRLLDVIDSRTDGKDAGMFGRRVLELGNITDIVRQQLLQAGLQPAISGTADHDVIVRLKKLYITQKLGINTPVVVYEVTIDRQAPFLIRPQASTINWNGNESEMYKEFNTALMLANVQLISDLNRHCA